MMLQNAVSSPSEKPDEALAALELRQITKQFGAVQALRGVDIAIRAGEVHAIVGENGAGKSTLIAIAAGSLSASSGSVLRAGTAVLPNATLMRELGVSVAYQHHSLVPDLTVFENLQLVSARFQGADGRLAANDLIARIATERRGIDIATRVAELSLAEMHVVEIARALASDPRVMFFDEPTEPFQQEDVDRLFALIGELKAAGVAVVYVSHRLHEVMAIADRISVMRDGEIIANRVADTMTTGEIVNLIAGRPLDQVFPAKASSADRVVLKASQLEASGFAATDFLAHAGEIVGLAGVEGEGQRQFLRHLAGLSPRRRGSLTVLEKPVGAGSTGSRDASISFVSDDRHAEGLFLPLSIAENLGLGIHATVSRNGVIDSQRQRQMVSAMTHDIRVKAPSINVPVTALSGGNQQKVLIARELGTRPAVLLIDEPTKGVDVGSRSEIYARLRALADGGTAVVVCSSDGIELEGLCDRVVIFSRGRVVAQLTGAQVTDVAITAANLMATGTRDIETSPPQEGLWRRFLCGDHFPGLVGLVAIAAIFAAMGLISPFFLSPFNLGSIAQFVALLALIAVGQMAAIMVGGIDLSVGAVAGISVIIASFLLPMDASGGQIALGLSAILLAGASIGLLHGLLIAVLSLPAIVVTLATLIGVQGLSLILRPTPGGMITYGISDIAGLSVLGVPAGLLAVVAIVVGLELVLFRTTAGRTLRAVGSSAAASQRLGINTRAVTVVAFVVSGTLAAAGGILLAGQIGMGSAGIGLDYSIMSITAVVIGGASIAGGRGSVIGTLVGAALVQIATSVSSFLNSDSSVHYAVLGSVTLLAAAIFSVAARRQKSDGRDM